MLLKGLRRAAACAVLGCATAGATGQEVVRGSGETRTAYASVNIDGLSAAPRYAPGPGMVDGGGPQAEAGYRSQNPVLVPLPTPFLLATSGLTSLALIFAWRRHRLRAE